MKVLFLDIDGVLNRLPCFDAVAESNTIERECVGQLNRIIHATGCKVVLSSAWRYMVHGKAMTRQGFAYMLRTHGATAELDIVGCTAKDEEVTGRAAQVESWLYDRKRGKNAVSNWCCVDDKADLVGDMPQEQCHVTNGGSGLTEIDASRIIHILNRETL